MDKEKDVSEFIYLFFFFVEYKYTVEYEKKYGLF